MGVIRREYGLMQSCGDIQQDIKGTIQAQKEDILATTWPHMRELLDAVNAVDRALPVAKS